MLLVFVAEVIKCMFRPQDLEELAVGYSFISGDKTQVAFGPKKKKVSVVRVKLHNEELRGLYFHEMSSDISQQGG
jgi:formate dehydrogenase assembly factor FdhD